jgi:hypothetical protein
MAKPESGALRGALICSLGTLLLSGCGGGGSGNVGRIVDGEPASNLVVAIDFPPPHSSLRGAAETAVSGTVSDEHDGTLDAGDIDVLDVNGVSVSVDLATGRWSGVLPLAAGQSPQQITATVTGRNGIASSTTITVENQPAWPDYSYLSLLPGGDSAVIWGSSALRSVNRNVRRRGDKEAHSGR